MSRRTTQSLTPQEALELHRQALVVDTMYPAFLSVPTERIRKAFEEQWEKPGAERRAVQAAMRKIISKELWVDPDAGPAYQGFWQSTGVTVGCVSVVNPTPNSEVAFSEAVENIANQVYGPALSSNGAIRVAVNADDVSRAHADGVHAMMIKFDNSSPIGHDLDRVDMFHNLGLRSVQLTYNLRSFAGDGCLERNPAGISRFGIALIEKLNDRRVLVDVSHASNPTALDAAKYSKSPIWMSHGGASAVFDHPRNSSDEVLKAVADSGGYIGVGVVAGFLQKNDRGTLDDIADHIEHFVDVAGIDHVGIGTDVGDIYTTKADPAMATDPEKFARYYPSGFPWHGFKREHRTFITEFEGYNDSSDWPKLTVHLAKRGFNEEEIRKLLGLNFLRVFRDVVG